VTNKKITKSNDYTFIGYTSISFSNTKIFIPVTRRVKGYTRFVGKYVTGRRKYER